MSRRNAEIGIIGGSGLYAVEALKDVLEIRMKTPFGAPSAPVVLGTWSGRRVAFLARHGRGHRLLPSEVNFRANLYAFKTLGVERVLSVSAVGSMKESIRPGDVVLPDQFIDITRRRDATFFGGGVVAHVGMADPVCPELRPIFLQACRHAGATVHDGGAYLCIEGPQFSTRGESLMYRQWGVDVIGMTNATEAKLAREAELCYTTLALATDYDCWHREVESVSVDAVVAILTKNVELSKRILGAVVAKIPVVRMCPCKDALAGAIITDRGAIPARAVKRLGLIGSRHLGGKRGRR